MLTLNLLNVKTVLVALTVGLLVYLIRRRFIYRLPPGPWAIPLIGNFEVYTKPLVHRVILQLSKKYGPVIQFYFGPIPTVFLNNYEVVIEALVKRKADFAGRPTSVTFSLISEGFKDIALASYSPMWQYHRRVAIKALRNYLQGDLLEKLTQDNMTKVMNMMAAEKGPIVVKSHMDNIVFYQLFTLCFGEKKEIGDPDVEFLLREKDSVNKAIGNGLREDLLPFLKDVYPSRRYVIIKEAVDRAFSFMYKLLHEHQETFDPNNIRDLTDHLLLARSEAEKSGDDESMEKLNDTYLVQTISDIFFAGVDTTRMTLEWFLCFISGLPEIQAKCQAEIDETIGRRCPSIADRQSLPYTEACLYETMRLGVIAGLGLPHLTICDTHAGGYDIPKDTVVLINHFALHRDPKYWKDPEKFDPLRYLDEDGKMDPTKLDSWLPFSAGRRVCLGESIAKPEILMMCVHLLQRFKISLPEGVKPNFVGVHRNVFGSECPADLQIVVKERSI
ncbi:steroid 17-alpha-hydroxylase/17,20 lyase-like [Crassostrea angulata]|uniref:steroid 17-alpha-hydroxylase/17,20 lyase-like n=1 Tax=Magallana angulata TaxID=2784310 RepID=UPI0022B19BBB|nr:steroid 17-alpha-hydroxylase/17,20 lyase-like [Crassostrea angulata]XP_052674507.1 steroid 17-alpha-hydroxylase/17,20 lyase-like [Crassostrea angulata]